MTAKTTLMPAHGRSNFRNTVMLLAAGHGLNDLVAGYFLGSLVQDTQDILQAGMGLILYNLLAFGGQYPAALLLEKTRSPKKFLLISYALNIVAISLFFLNPQIAVVLAGVASALYHVAGGTICAQQNKAIHIGLFAAPGVAGLIAGGYFAFARMAVGWWLLATASLFFLILVLFPLHYKANVSPKQKIDKSKGFAPDQHDIIMILLLTIISLRSVVWNVFQLIHENNYYWLIAIAASAFIGKIAGGWMADKIGWRLYMICSLAAAMPLITFFKKEMILFCIGIGLLQSGIPATTALLIRSMKGSTEKAIGLAFGFSIIAGAIIFYTPARVWLFSDIAICIITATMFILMYVFSKRVSENHVFGKLH